MANVTKIWNGSSWVAGLLKVWNGSAWVEKPKYWNGSAWVDLFAAAASVVLSPSTASVFTLNPLADAYAKVKYNSSGSEQQSPTGGTNTWVSRGTWLDSGSAADVWISWVRNSGSSANFSNYSGWTSGVRIQASTANLWFGYGPVQTFQQGSYTVSFWDAASGGNLITSVTFTLDANGPLG